MLSLRKNNSNTTDLLAETNGECLALPGKCEFKSCRHHMDGEITPDGLKMFGDNCSVRIASAGQVSVENVSKALGISKQAVKQCETMALAKLNTVENAFVLGVVGD